MKSILKNTPKTPWVYQFFDKKWEIIYIWKSVNLFSRVNSYFNWKSKLSFAKKKMVDKIVDIKTIITNNETESLILETTLIKKHSPKYNILMKDDKNHLYIKITNEKIPRIIKTRIKTKWWEYFGPYISTSSVNNILSIIKKIFWYRSCNIDFFEDSWVLKMKNIWNTKIPCMDYYIWRCSWPCLLKYKYIQSYLNKIEEIRFFLKWNFTKVKESLEEKMKNYAKELKFEDAEKIKNDMISLSILEENQIVRDKINWNYDIINYIEKYNKFFIWLIEIRESKITGYNNYEIQNNLDEEKSEILKSFLERRISEDINNKKVYILPEKINTDLDIIIEVPKIGWKLDLLKLCYKNIYEYAYKKHLAWLSTKWFTKKTMIDLLNKLGYKQLNENIIFECNDISHLSWTHTVASRSIIENWKPNKSKYKKIKIKSLENLKIDDFSSLKEVILRRCLELKNIWNYPDLIIIDWWKWQLSSVMKILESEWMIDKLQMVSIAKKEEELFLPGITKPIILSKDSNELRLVQKIRDEAHRFAITFNRDSRIKSQKKNIIESLPWFWPKTRTKILKKYWSLEALNNVSKSDLNNILTSKQIETLEDHWII